MDQPVYLPYTPTHAPSPLCAGKITLACMRMLPSSAPYCHTAQTVSLGPVSSPLSCLGMTTSPLSLPYQVARTEHVVEVLRHGVMFHGHEEGVEHDTDGDAQVHEGVHDDQVDDVLEFHPWGTAVPYEQFVGTLVPPRWALLVSLF